ncbi:hypothetical protein, partial [Ligilactobacillus salivarius]|uniref:hypothetical protein n=1 Tax=Ligilactobacillus salivarius TaxID=1624 RepID=UPI00254B82AA
QQFQFLPLYKKSSYTFYDNSIGGFQIFSYSAHYKVLTKQKQLYNDLKLVQYDLTTGNQYLYRTKFFEIG